LNTDVTVITPKSSLPKIELGTTTVDKEPSAGVKIPGSKEKAGELLGLVIKFDPRFNIVTA